MKPAFLAVVGGLAFSAFLLASPVHAQSSKDVAGGERVDAGAMSTIDSTPAEQAETAALNNQIAAGNAAIDSQAAADSAEYRAQQQRYQDQLRQYQKELEQNQAQQQTYRDRSAAYEEARARAAAHDRGVGPDHDSK